MISVGWLCLFSILSWGVVGFITAIHDFCKTSSVFIWYSPKSIQYQYTEFVDLVSSKTAKVYWSRKFAIVVGLLNITFIILAPFVPIENHMMELTILLNSALIVVGINNVRWALELYNAQMDVGLFDFTNTELQQIVLKLKTTWDNMENKDDANDMLHQNIHQLIIMIEDSSCDEDDY